VPFLRRRNSRLLFKYSSAIVIVLSVVEDGGRMNYAEPITGPLPEKTSPLGIVRCSA